MKKNCRYSFQSLGISKLDLLKDYISNTSLLSDFEDEKAFRERRKLKILKNPDTQAVKESPVVSLLKEAFHVVTKAKYKSI